ncbi:unnamed protein product [Mytilus coruscus]|uniref:MAM domain-containing protein n=1 Tax=Mytilus coruscus TaxID=42192 RepID=A0A6J8C1T2_MYTCO|nr:unnamed protein product [Mytilus coruscus]
MIGAVGEDAYNTFWHLDIRCGVDIHVRNIQLLNTRDLYYTNMQPKGFQENTFVSNYSTLSCDGNTTINIVDLNVEKAYATSCSEYKPCNLTGEQTNAIKTGCNKEKSCTISTIIPTSCLFKDYSHVTISYSCKGIVNRSCKFANKDHDDCGWRVNGNDRYKWTLQSGNTPETYTGPGRDHTTSSASGYYAYTESRSGSKLNDESYLLSGLILPSPKQCMTFWYHMYGKHINTLKVFQRNSENDRYVELWSKSENQGNKWHFQSLTLQNIGSYQIIFKAIRGDGDKSEIAVDDILITNTVCMKASTIDCNFETTKCGWSLADTAYKWKLWHGRTPSDDTGPDVDHTLGTNAGHYIYLEASSIPRGQKLNFTSLNVYPDGNACFNFWYHMYGDGIGTLNVYLDTKEVSKIDWSKSGNWKKKWLLASFDVSTSEPYNIIFEGIRGSTTKSDIALDDISLLFSSSEEGLINYSQTCLKTDKPITISECSKYYLQFSKINLTLDQKFDDCSTLYKDVQASKRTICNNMNNSDICMFNLSEVIRKDPGCFQSNRLLVEYTCEDIRLPNISSDDSQTKKSFLDIDDGHYIYIDASSIQPGQKSNYTSVSISPDGDACFTFWFHMHGNGMGTLNVYVVSDNITQKLWSRSGNKPDIWQLAFVDISITEPYQMTLEGVRGSTKSGDIAVDDISLLPGSCNKRAFILDCNFEAENCSWLVDSETSYNWTVFVKTNSTEDTSPAYYDHTIGTGTVL